MLFIERKLYSSYWMSIMDVWYGCAAVGRAHVHVVCDRGIACGAKGVRERVCVENLTIDRWQQIKQVQHMRPRQRWDIWPKQKTKTNQHSSHYIMWKWIFFSSNIRDWFFSDAEDLCWKPRSKWPGQSVKLYPIKEARCYIHTCAAPFVLSVTPKYPFKFSGAGMCVRISELDQVYI